ncbi:hypothetical protein PBMFNG_PBMFNG_15740, partial [Dysosmobacter welbionis]
AGPGSGAFLFHGDEHPHPGRARRHRAGHRCGSGAPAAADCLRPGAAPAAGGCDAPGPCHRVPHQRRRPCAGVPPLPRTGGFPPFPRRPRRAG